MKKELQTIDGQTLMNTPLDARRFVLSSLMPTGLHILGGAPKVGKSWLVLWMCLQIAKGENVWNYECRKGTTLYLCLEDSFERIQSRLYDITDDAPDNIHFAILANSINDGLTEQIENFLALHPDTNFIVIDTLQNIRSENNNSNPYANDYKELTVLRTLANKHKIAILCVHHLRKMKDDDPMNTLSGTTGLTGVMDTIFILHKDKRFENRATLYCTGRDIESNELEIVFDGDNHIWHLASEDETEVKLIDETAVNIMNFIESLTDSFSGTATELSYAVEKVTGEKIHPATLKRKLLEYNGLLKERGYCLDFRRTHTEKIIEITIPCVGASVETI